MKRLSFLFLLISNFSFGQQWSDAGGGADYQVRSFYNDTVSNLLYVGGGFDHLGGSVTRQIGIWDGISWTAIGSNEQFTHNSFSGSVEAITKFNGDLIVAGLFDSVGGMPVHNIARWDGTQWNAIGNGFDGIVSAVQVYHDELYVGGNFTHSGPDTIYYVAKWNGINWSRLDQNIGLDNLVLSFCIHNDVLIMGGGFYGTFPNNVHSASVIGWNGTNWISFAQGFSTYTYTVKVIRDTLFAVGDFSNSITNLHYISKWDGQSWLPMPHPTGGSQPWITDIVEYLNNTYVCGYFTTPPDIAKFNGSDYDSVGNAVGFIKKMIVYNNELYVAGGFSSINGIPLLNIARYNISNGIEEQTNADNSFFVFPNPILKNQSLNFQFNNIASDYCFNLFDTRGKNIDQFSLHNNESSIMLPDKLKSGIYFITTTDRKKNIYSVKLILH
jgi:hypothetical protein